MFGMGKTKSVADVHPRTAWIAELDKIIAAGKSRKLNLRVMADDLKERSDAIRFQPAVTCEPRKVHNMNLPQ
jgi:hypothetical protein